MSNESNSDQPVDHLKTKTESSEDNSDTNGSGFPLNIDHRFEYIKDLGKGGGGLVCLAYDHKLQRKVALKFLLSSDLIDIKTLFKEARAQAQLKHESICQIYEVLEAEGQIYLVMQYIQGDELEHLSDQFTLEQKLLIIEKILRGLHQSHTQGIIHRDIKPSNILVEVSDQGEIKPYLIDFGIAHAHNQLRQDVLVTGIGTPIYMAPEQADHESIHIDRRADIYSMGATLYHLLCGFPPVKVNDTTATTSRKWTEFLGEPLMSFAESVPEDLQTLILKCLQIEPNSRYSSAKELADEIEKYLNGDPISAHKGSAYRVKKKIRKNKLLVSITSVFLLALISTGGWFIYESHQQSIREELIQDFTSRVENLEARVRFTYMAPLHDISPAIEKWRLEIKELEKEIESLGEIAYGPGHYAIGRMHYAFQEYDDALEHLNLAWESGFQQPRVAYILALTNGAIYQRQKNIINSIQYSEARKDKLAFIEKKYRKPAIKLLEKGMQASPYRSMARAKLLYYLENYNKALEEISQEKHFPIWFYQHRMLEGDIYLALAEKYSNSRDNDKVFTNIKLASKKYNSAMEVAPSNFQLRLKPLSLSILKIKNLLFGKAGDYKEEFSASNIYFNLANKIIPNNYQTYFLNGQILSLEAEHENQFNGRPIDTQDKAIEQFEAANKIAPDKTLILFSLARAYTEKMALLQTRELSIDDELDKAIIIFNSIEVQNRDYYYYTFYANFLRGQALKLIKSNFKEGEYYFNKAIENYEKALELKPKNIPEISNLASIYRLWSNYLAPNDAENKLKLALELYKSALRINPEHFVSNYYTGVTYRRLAQINDFLFEDTLTNTKLSEDYLNKALVISSDHPFVVNEIALLNRDRAIYSWQSGLHFNHLIATALSKLKISLIKNPNNHILNSTTADILLTKYQLLTLTNSISSTAAKEAEDFIKPLIFNSNYDLTTYNILKLLQNKNLVNSPIDNANDNDERNLFLKALWYSKTKKFETAEKYFLKIKQMHPAILWNYYHEHLLSWENHNEVYEIKIHSVKEKIEQLNNDLSQHYPAL